MFAASTMDGWQVIPEHSALHPPFSTLHSQPSTLNLKPLSLVPAWQELVAIPFIRDDEVLDSATVPTAHGGLIFFFVSFFLIVAWTLLPVVVAVLLDNFRCEIL